MTESDPDPRILELFFSPPRVAIIGLSRAAVGAPTSILTTLKEFGYQGRITVINPNTAPSEEYEAYASLDEVPEAVDLAVIPVPRERAKAARPRPPGPSLSVIALRTASDLHPWL